MNYLTQYYKNLSEQLQQRVNILTRKVKYLTESGPVLTDDGNEGSGNVTATPIGGGGYVSPAGVPGGVNPSNNPFTQPDIGWKKVPWNPNLPQNPTSPITPVEWVGDNPQPDWSDYDVNGDGALDDAERSEYHRDLEHWHKTFRQIRDNYEQWRREVRDRNQQMPGIAGEDWRFDTLPYWDA